MLTLSQILTSAETGQSHIRTTPSFHTPNGLQSVAYLQGIADLAAFLQDESDVRSSHMRVFIQAARLQHAVPPGKES